jgi:phosphatidylserine decarboxylase
MSDFSWSDRPSETAYPVARPGYPFIFMAGFATAVFALAGVSSLALFGLFLTLFICFFFRDPDRLTPVGEGIVVSPADGKVIFEGAVAENDFIDGPCRKISVFMSVFNVHVNRIPHEGTVKKVMYFPGKFFNASLDKASKDNEHNAVVVETAGGKTYCAVQIAGLVARRIICRVQPGDTVVRGGRFGMICFGSRLDIYLPDDARINVSVGERVKAGSSVLGYF